MKFNFGNIVVVDENQIGIIVKSWINDRTGKHTYDVYVRSYNCVVNMIPESEIKHFEYDKEIEL